VADGDSLALSAAMPGLAGAVLRRGGFYAPCGSRSLMKPKPRPLRRGNFRHSQAVQHGRRELGPEFLKQGVLVSGDQLRNFVERQGRWLGTVVWRRKPMDSR